MKLTQKIASVVRHAGVSRCSLGLALGLLLPVGAFCAPASCEQMAKQILDTAGIKGGMIVHLDCGDGKLTAALRASDSYIVQGLVTDASKVAGARKTIRDLGLYGPVSVARWDGKHLPYADNMVSLLVAENLADVPPAEVQRVLEPLGVVCTRRDGKWTRSVKPWPEEMDGWTHWQHDAGNNAVAHDALVGPPRRMRWVAGPLWCRGHEVISSVGGLVTARGRIFYALDEGQSGIYTLPAKWTLVARDAFNGVLLWQHSIPHWEAPVVLGGFGTGFRPRRLATDGLRVYLPTGAEAELTAIDAATGQTVKSLSETRGTTDVLCDDGMLVAACSPEAASSARTGRRPAPTIIAARADTLDVLWKVPMGGLARQTLALAADRVFCKAGNDIVALDAKTGRKIWRTPLRQSTLNIRSRRGRGATLVIADGIVYVQGGGRLAAMSADTGRVLWDQPGRTSSKGELFAAAGLVWQTIGAHMVGRDVASGQVRKTIDASDVFSLGHHPRCYPDKATDRYMITNNRGAEFISLTSKEHVGNDWIRGNCGLGVTPANGLLYAPPCQCFCYGGVMVKGFKALATGPAVQADTPPGADRLERGPAYQAVANGQRADADDWPMYRYDAARFGSTNAAVAPQVKPLWRIKLAGPLTPPVEANGLVLVAAKNEHTVYALAASDGRQRWAFTAGGRIDSPPTVHDGLVLFGCADGWAYCLRASDGALAWRFRGAPRVRLIGAFGQIESAWPIHGSVLVVHDVAYFTAGRSTWLDGGIYAYGLDPRSGRVVHYARLDGRVGAPAAKPNQKAPYLPSFYVEGARSDLLVSDGSALYMGPLKLDLSLKRMPTPYVHPPKAKTTGLDLTHAPYVDTAIFRAAFLKRRGTDIPSLGVLRGPMGDKLMGLHLVTTGGFLDASGFNRIYWMYSDVWPGYYIANLAPKTGQILSVDATTTYAVQYFPTRSIHSPTFTPAAKGYLLVADGDNNDPVLDSRSRDRDKGMGYTRLAPPKWFHWLGVRVRGMAATRSTLFVAGPPDAAPQSDPYSAFEGKMGGKLLAFDKTDGHKLAELKLDTVPVFDGLIAANSSLFVTTTDGSVLCLRSAK
jgi:outer membrane protein assembly factor BamB